MSPEELKTLIRQLDLHPSRQRGQNFLADNSILESIATAAESTEDDIVIEVGPGLGTLTDCLLARGGQIHAIELDRILIPWLKQKYWDQKRLTLHEGDALNLLPSLLSAWPQSKLVANIPYNITTPLLQLITEHPTPPETIVMTVQKEMAERMAASAGCRDFSALTVFIQLYYHASLGQTIPARAFYPAPEVDSAILILKRRTDFISQIPDKRLFRHLIKTSFATRRKMLKNHVHLEDGTSLADLLTSLSLNPNARAEELGVEDWIRLYQKLGETGKRLRHAPSAAAGKAEEVFDIVNLRDEVIGQVVRSEVHRQNLHHRAVHILVFNSAGELFLQKRSAFKDLHPNVWDSSCSGHVDSGSDYDTSAIRELGEELGIPADQTHSLKRLFKLDTCAETGREFVWVYRLEHNGPFILPPEEISEGRYFVPAHIDEWVEKSPADFAPAFVYLWKKFRSNVP